MPSFEFEVYCGRCGAGICSQTVVDGQSITVHCKHCNKEIDGLQDDIRRLESEIADLEANHE